MVAGEKHCPCFFLSKNIFFSNECSELFLGDESLHADHVVNVPIHHNILEALQHN